MKITNHISFYYIEDRIKYVNTIIDETNKYPYITDIFIHTNKEDLQIDSFNKYNNGTLNIVYHDLSDCHHFKLTWKCRDLLEKQKNDYDIFMYIEDDMLVPCAAINYWMKYNKKLIENEYNLGFVRIETNAKNEEFITDLPGKRINTTITLDNEKYGVNGNPYCAFWIYNKEEFNKFVESKYYNLSAMPNWYGDREKSAIGLHSKGWGWYKSTIIPIVDKNLTKDCRIYHLPNNYVNDKRNFFASIPFEKCIDPKCI